MHGVAHCRNTSAREVRKSVASSVVVAPDVGIDLLLVPRHRRRRRRRQRALRPSSDRSRRLSLSLSLPFSPHDFASTVNSRERFSASSILADVTRRGQDVYYRPANDILSTTRDRRTGACARGCRLFGTARAKGREIRVGYRPRKGTRHALCILWPPFAWPDICDFEFEIYKDFVSQFF